jgi:hypothetical protein
VPETKVERVKLVEMTEARNKDLRADDLDYVLAATEEKIKFDTKFPSWTSWVRSPSPAPKFSFKKSPTREFVFFGFLVKYSAQVTKGTEYLRCHVRAPQSN